MISLDYVVGHGQVVKVGFQFRKKVRTVSDQVSVKHHEIQAFSRFFIVDPGNQFLVKKLVVCFGLAVVSIRGYRESQQGFGGILLSLDYLHPGESGNNCS